MQRPQNPIDKCRPVCVQNEFPKPLLRCECSYPASNCPFPKLETDIFPLTSRLPKLDMPISIQPVFTAARPRRNTYASTSRRPKQNLPAIVTDRELREARAVFREVEEQKRRAREKRNIPDWANDRPLIPPERYVKRLVPMLSSIERV